VRSPSGVAGGWADGAAVGEDVAAPVVAAPVAAEPVVAARMPASWPAQGGDHIGRPATSRPTERTTPSSSFRPIPADRRRAYASEVVRNLARSVWAEPRAPDPPPPQWWDLALVAAFVVGILVEAIVRDDLAWPAASLLLSAVIAPAVYLRRQHPLVALVAVFGMAFVVDVAALGADVPWEGMNAQIVMIFPLFALYRWGSGREMVAGSWLVLACVAITVSDGNPVEDLVGGTLMVMFVAALGTAVRYRAGERRRGVDQVKLREREQLARELHDSVAHHVSAIAVQAQAGRTVAGSRPDAAVDALAVVESEASRALEEMRTIVGALRQGDGVDLTPQRGAADITQFARRNGNPPVVDVTLSGELSELPPPVDAALYRLAQESVTNALRHARHATTVEIEVRVTGDRVRLTVRDDGEASPAGASGSSGFGLLGMAERARLLGGTFAAGPNGGRGWTVTALLPTSGRPA
jgi:signal transduction histidine kinase